MITKNNYHIYAIDYIEGNLTPELQEQFEKFLSQNPQIKQQIDELKGFTIPKSHKSLDITSKINLKKSQIDGLTYFDELCIAEIENTIHPQQKQELYNLIANSDQHKKTFEQYKLTKLQPPTVFFPYKQKLKKTKRAIIYAKTFASIAAVVLIMLAIINLKSFQHSIHYFSHPQAFTITYPQWKYIYPVKNTEIKNLKFQNLTKTKTNKLAIQQTFKHDTSIQTKIINPSEPAGLTFEKPKLNLKITQNPQIALNTQNLYIYNNPKKFQQTTNLNKTAIIVNNLKYNLSKNLSTFAYKKASAISHRGFRIKIKNKVYGFYVSR